MFTIRRWWDRHWLHIVLMSFALGTAWFLRQTQGAALSEVYYFLTAPFEGEERAQIENRLKDARFQELEQRITELDKQNQQLKQLLGYVKTQKQKVITAPIISRSSDRWWNQISIGRGSEDGIKEGFIVTGVGGLVGRVTQVTPHTSRILLASDPTSRIGVSLSRNRYLGYLQGNSGQTAVMHFYEKVTDVRAGDVVVTSAVSERFPAGLPVGRVISLQKRNSRPIPEAIVQLTAPFSYLEWVVVHPFQGSN
jgi:rod shape-determining protein MreC